MESWLLPYRTPRVAARVATADRQARAQAVLLQPSWSCSQTCWSLHLLLLRHCHVTVPEPFSYLARRFLHARDQRCLHSLHRRGTSLVNGHRPRDWTSDLFSSQSRPELGGSPVESWLHPYCSGQKGERGGQFTSNLRPRWTDPVTARRVPSK